ncbi:hypothetical protein BH24ACT16_BH24ACT16_17410 [soil metagenome]
MSYEEPLGNTELWIMRVGWTVIAAGIVLGVLQHLRNR